MSLAVDVASTGRLPVARERLAELARGVLRAERVHDALLSIAFVSSEEITRLNQRHLRRRQPTDIIAFGFERAAEHEPVIGDIYIAPDVARENAVRHGVSVREELARLVVHGTLHVLGHDHPEDESRVSSPMWRRQERLLARLFGGRA
jgi:probable rRNA maturation factor